MSKLSFDEWWEALQAIGNKEGWPIDYGKEAFKEMYEEGVSVEDAFWDEIDSAKSYLI